MFVSIPQSGLQAFRPGINTPHSGRLLPFQSLNRAYKRSDAISWDPVHLPPGGFNPSIGLTSVPTGRWQPCRVWQKPFQSLNRAYKRSDGQGLRGLLACWSRFNPSIGLTSVPTMCAPSFLAYAPCFNPSIGLTSVPTAPLRFVAFVAICFNPSIGLTSVPTAPRRLPPQLLDLFQSLNRAYKRSDEVLL